MISTTEQRDLSFVTKVHLKDFSLVMMIIYHKKDPIAELKAKWYKMNTILRSCDFCLFKLSFWSQRFFFSFKCFEMLLLSVTTLFISLVISYDKINCILKADERLKHYCISFHWVFFFSKRKKIKKCNIYKCYTLHSFIFDRRFNIGTSIVTLGQQISSYIS